MPCHGSAGVGEGPGGCRRVPRPGKRDRRRQRAGRAESRQPASNGSARVRATQQRINRRLTSQAPLAGSWQASDKHVRGMVVCEVPLISSHLICAAGSGRRAVMQRAMMNYLDAAPSVPHFFRPRCQFSHSGSSNTRPATQLPYSLLPLPLLPTPVSRLRDPSAVQTPPC
jgi:hypothetical protein